MTDWTILGDEGVAEAVDSAARRISGQYADTTDYDDAAQEAYIVLATRAVEARAIIAKSEGPGLLARWLYQRLADKVKTESKHRKKHESYDEMLLNNIGPG